MAKVEAVEIRPGQLLEWDKRVWRVLKSYHVHVGGRGGAFMQVEMKDIDKGTKTNQRFRTEDKIERAFVEPREMQYLYQDGESYVFMDKENYEQLTLAADFLEGQAGYLLPNTDVQINFYNSRPIGIELPPSVVQAGEDGDRHHGAGAALHQQGREDQDRHRRRHLHGARLSSSRWFFRPPVKGGSEHRERGVGFL
jgi:elongation factor P